MFFDIPMPVVRAFQVQSELRLKEIERAKRKENEDGVEIVLYAQIAYVFVVLTYF